MKKIGIIIVYVLMLVLSAVAYPDTFYLKNGIVFDGKIVGEETDNTLTIKVGNHILKYKKDEIEKIEKNEKTGEINIESYLKEWEEKDKYLTQITGLNKDQRVQVEAILGKLQWGEEIERAGAKDALLELNKKINIYPYLLYYFPSFSPNVAPHILEIMLKINKDKTVELLREKLFDSAPTIRAKAIELLASVRDEASKESIIRGLVDPDIDVCIISIQAVTYLGIKEITPVLVDYLEHPDMRIVNTSREALNILWKGTLGGSRIENIKEWRNFWENNKSLVSSPIFKENLTPLVDKEFKYFIG
ncbi:MAG: HEAT repeat domain-containing protein [Candidatus Hydrogenedentes bacterium]|nr:HEAT repeat domain-containing protein [Candidatus Hydrogenedentota bacterium]